MRFVTLILCLTFLIGGISAFWGAKSLPRQMVGLINFMISSIFLVSTFILKKLDVLIDEVAPDDKSDN